MTAKALVHEWFNKCELGDFLNLPITEDFTHTSPYGTIEGRIAYIKLVEANKDKFLGHRFNIHDILWEDNKACVRYTAIKDDFRLEVSEWFYIKNDLISKIVAHYNIEGDISDERKLQNLPNHES